MFSSVPSYFRSLVFRASFSNFRAFHTTPTVSKTVTEKASDVADKVHKKVGNGVASVIEKGAQVTQSTKETMGASSNLIKNFMKAHEHAGDAMKKVKDKAEHASHTAEEASKAAGEQTKHASNVAGQKLDHATAGARGARDNLQKDMTK
ncbi:hypothetical protein C0995_014183 [Termitomyces sp. Mi166|nr:hypothetical protein C0995_014183 [Termitomyces sp. Mi166\